MHRSGPAPRRVLAHAKVNLFLAVGPRRPDGFHEVTTVLQALGLADEIEVRLTSGSGTTLEREVDIGVAPEQDLAFRAAEAWRAVTGYGAGIDIRLAKRIPIGAGLGGGSSDAAGVLAALRAWHADGPGIEAPILGVARTLGADVPFFLGAGTQLMAGRGDEPVRTLRTPRLHITLVNPGVAVPTAAAYAQFDRDPVPPPPGPEAMVQAVADDVARGIAVRLYNNMTQASCALVPEIRGALRFLEDASGVLGSAMAGSGSSVFGIFENEASARAAAHAASAHGWWSQATVTAAQGVDIASDESQSSEGSGVPK